VQDWVSSGLPAKVLQLLKSVQVLYCNPDGWQPPQLPHCQFGVQAMVHDSETTGFPPVHPHGKDEVTVLVLVPELLHSDQLVYVNEVQAEDW
jgi:hypothetical protein